MRGVGSNKQAGPLCQWQEWYSHGWQDKEWRDQYQPRQRLSHAQTNTRKLVQRRQSDVSVVVKFTCIRVPFTVLRISQFFFGSFASRQ